jgi:hypothetical protein
MARVDWVILCERAVIESPPGNTVSLVGLLETVSMPAPPAEITEKGQLVGVPFRFYVVQQWVRAQPKISERVPARVVLKGPNKKQFGIAEFSVDLTAVPKARVVSQLGGFPLAGAGIYKCLVQAKRGKDWRTLGETEFTVAFLTDTATRH